MNKSYPKQNLDPEKKCRGSLKTIRNFMLHIDFIWKSCKKQSDQWMEGTGILQRHELSVFTAKLSFMDKSHIFNKSRYFEGSSNMLLSLSHSFFGDKLLHSLHHNIYCWKCEPLDTWHMLICFVSSGNCNWWKTLRRGSLKKQLPKTGKTAILTG